ncbi:hypothetical protein [Piscirickettsia litoralis]|nr:hypothetical protein [Piscirickettsia litoralis]
MSELEKFFEFFEKKQFSGAVTAFSEPTVVRHLLIACFSRILLARV